MNNFDYLILGKNLGGLAFADTMLTCSDATIAIIDDSPAIPKACKTLVNFPIGRMQDEHLGVGSYTFKDWRSQHRRAKIADKDRSAGLQAYCAHLVTQRMLPSGRVELFDGVEHFGNGHIRSLKDGHVRDLVARRRIVDATRFPSTPCKARIPSFSIAPGVHAIRPDQRDIRLSLQTSEFDSFCVLGGGRVGTEMVLTLLDLGVSHDKIRWVKSRDAWMLAAETRTDSSDRVHDGFSRQHEVLQAMAFAQNRSDLCLRLEHIGVIVRTSKDRLPVHFVPHQITHHDADRLSQVENVIRKGHVRAISEIGILLSRGAVPMPSKSLYLDCTGQSGSQYQTKAVFQPRSINLADIRLNHPCFSAAMIGAIELLDLPTEEKNKLCAPLRGGHMAELFLTSLLNHHAWFHDVTLRNWLEGCRLDTGLQISAQRLNQSEHVPKDLGAIRAILPRAIINLESMAQRDHADVKRAF
ncbi:MAG: hypothetical protein AAFW60_00080 [Pseudomonadota bacterium]